MSPITMTANLQLEGDGIAILSRHRRRIKGEGTAIADLDSDFGSKNSSRDEESSNESGKAHLG